MAKAIHTYTIPESLRSAPNGSPSPTKIGMQQLNADQELMASKTGRFDYMKAQYAAAKLSIVEFDGRKVDPDGTVDIWWDKADPKLRSLVLQAYNKLSSPSTEEDESFFGSEEMKVV
jgi:hypothetical protein